MTSFYQWKAIPPRCCHCCCCLQRGQLGLVVSRLRTEVRPPLKCFIFFFKVKTSLLIGKQSRNKDSQWILQSPILWKLSLIYILAPQSDLIACSLMEVIFGENTGYRLGSTPSKNWTRPLFPILLWRSSTTWKGQKTL